MLVYGYLRFFAFRSLSDIDRIWKGALEDRARRRYVRRYFNAKIDDPTLYDVTLNTGRFGFARAAEAIAQMALQHHHAFAGRDEPIVTMASSGLSG